jgi:hypothetical protein
LLDVGVVIFELLQSLRRVGCAAGVLGVLFLGANVLDCPFARFDNVCDDFETSCEGS